MAVSAGTKIGLGLVVVVLVGLGVLVGYATWAISADPAEEGALVVKIPPGMTAGGIGTTLADHNVVRSSFAFELRVRSRGLDRELKAGEYEFQRGMSVDEAIEVLMAGPALAEGIRFTVPEGLTVQESIQRVADQTFHTVEDYRQVIDARDLDLPGWFPDPETLGDGVREPLEGVLFPETYEVRVDASPQAVLQRMVDQLVRVFDGVPSEMHEAASDRDLSRYEMLIVASLIERETQVREELRTVSGVIKNRMEAGMRLEIDAALLYAIDERGRRVTAEVRRVDSPYNLYERDGLPPTPIGAPGRAAIEAAYDPEGHDYLYFVKQDEEGRHAFAETFEEHQRNVARFRELQREAEDS